MCEIIYLVNLPLVFTYYKVVSILVNPTLNIIQPRIDTIKKLRRILKDSNCFDTVFAKS